MRPLIVTMLAAWVGLAANGAQAAGMPRIEQTEIGEWPDATKIKNRTISADGQHYGWCVDSGNRSRPMNMVVVVDGKAGPTYDAAEWPGTLFSRDSKHWAYVARADGAYMVVVDGKPGDKYQYIAMPRELFSADSRHVYFEAIERAGKMSNKPSAPVRRVLVDQKTVAADNSPTSDLLYSPDSQHLAYVKNVNKLVEGAPRPGPGQLMLTRMPRAVVLDGKVGPAFDSIRGLAFSPNSKRLAYGANLRSDPNGKEYDHVAVVDGVSSAIYEGEVQHLVFSPDSKRVAYAVKTGASEASYAIVVDGKMGPAYDNKSTMAWSDDRLMKPMFSPDSKHVFYFAAKDGKQLVVIDGKAGEPHDAVGDLVYSRDSRRMAYSFVDNTKLGIIIDGKRADIGGTRPVFSPDSKRVAYRSRDGMVIDGILQKPRGVNHYKWGNVIAFSPDSQHVAYICDGHVVLDDEAVMSASVQPREYNHEFEFAADGALEFSMVKENKLYWVRIHPGVKEEPRLKKN